MSTFGRGQDMKCVESAYYYPYSGINLNRLDSIKQYLLYYENVSILDFGFDSLHDRDSIYIEDSEESKNDVEELKEAGLLKLVPPSNAMENASSSFIKDTKLDIELFSGILDDSSSDGSWWISNPKIAEEIARAIGISKDGTRWQNISQSQGTAILLNHAFYNCVKNNLTPFTDDPLYHRAFNLKIVRHAKEIHAQPVGAKILDIDKLPKPLREREIMSYVLKTTVPIWPSPHVIRIDQLLEFRKNTQNTRKHFREEIAKLSLEIAASSSEYSYEKLIDKYVQSYLNDLDSALRAIEVPNFEEMSPAKTALKGMFVSIGKTAIPLLDLVFRVARAGEVGLTSKEYQRIKSNGLFYLLEITQRFPHAPRH